LNMNLKKLRKDFPILRRRTRGKPLIYLDNAATTQKPAQVIRAIELFYKTSNANVHRGVYGLSERATEQYETARKKVAEFIGASPGEIVFVRNTTEALNLVARTFGAEALEERHTVLLTEMEHHSNLVPWQMVAEKKLASLDFVPITRTGELDLDSAAARLEKQPAAFSFVHASNVLGTINPARELCGLARRKGVPSIVDAAQSVPHMPIDVRDMGCDFLAFSGHKMLGPTGIGVLYGRREFLEKMEPLLGGGDMIKTVSLERSSWTEVPWKFEAGTPHVAGAIGLGAAVDYLRKIGMTNVAKHEQELTAIALEMLKRLGVTVYGPGPSKRSGVVSFNVDKLHPHDVATILDDEGIAIRAGHHCAQPLMGRLGVPATCRASFYIYNTAEEISSLEKGLVKARKVFKK